MSPVDWAIRRISRREALGLLGAAAAAGCSGSPTSASYTASATAGSGGCILTPALEEGPFFVDERLNRSDITANTTNINVINGVPLTLGITVQKYTGGTCSPLPGAQVDVWQADAAGNYGDEASEGTAGDPFLRGYQITDSAGLVTFKTIVPGWYAGRAVHIHAMVRVFSGSGSQTSKFETQLFFDPVVIAGVVGRFPYNARGLPDTSNSADRVYAGGGSKTLITTTGSVAAGYTGSITLGVQA